MIAFTSFQHVATYLIVQTVLSVSQTIKPTSFADPVVKVCVTLE